MPHFVFYPTMGTGEFLSLSKMSFDEVLNSTKSWDKEKPLIESCELSRRTDLTDNDILIRQINCSQILSRLLEKRIKEVSQSNKYVPCRQEFDFEVDFYGYSAFWVTKNTLVMRLITLTFALIYYPYLFTIKMFLFLERFDMLNCIVMIKRKEHQLLSCERYLKNLMRENPNNNQNLFDYHFYKMAMYSKFAAIMTQIILDIIMGLISMYILQAETHKALTLFHWILQGLELDVL